MFFQRIESLRKSRGISVAEISDFLKIPEAMYLEYESGNVIITTRIVIALSLFYGVSTDYILNLTDIC